jgi:uncharacterized protein YjbI with pentapeptide repeats
MGTIGKRVLWGGAAVALLTIAILIGYRYDITLWDWIKLLIVPAVIAGGGLWFNAQQREREQRIASERAQDEALQGYLDGMSQLLTDKERPVHSAQPGDSLSTVARARTLTVLGRLDSGRKRSVLQFLFESGMIYKEQTLLDEGGLIERRHNLISLEQADLRGADLLGTVLSGTYLRGADLRGAFKGWANLREADLSGANLSMANLICAARSKANLREADLSGANLREAKGVTNEQLSAAISLEGATMPNGQKYEDWLKDREKRQQDE